MGTARVATEHAGLERVLQYLQALLGLSESHTRQFHLFMPLQLHPPGDDGTPTGTVVIATDGVWTQ